MPVNAYLVPIAAVIGAGITAPIVFLAMKGDSTDLVSLLAKSPICTNQGDCVNDSPDPVPICAKRGDFQCAVTPDQKGVCAYAPIGSSTSSPHVCPCYVGAVSSCYKKTGDNEMQLGTQYCEEDMTPPTPSSRSARKTKWGECKVIPIP